MRRRNKKLTQRGNWSFSAGNILAPPLAYWTCVLMHHLRNGKENGYKTTGAVALPQEQGLHDRQEDTSSRTEFLGPDI